MPTLANINGATLVPDLTQQLNMALGAFGTPQTRAAQAQNLSAAQQTQTIQAQNQQTQQQAISTLTGGGVPGSGITGTGAPGTGAGTASQSAAKQKALISLASVNPQAASSIQKVIASGNAAQIAAIQREVDKGARQAKIIKGKSSFKDKQRALADMAANAAAAGEDLTRLIELSNMSEGQLDVEMDKMLLQATDIKTLTKPAAPFTLSEGQTRFGGGGQPIASVAKETETFEPVKDDKGRIVGQRNTVTGKVIEDPRAKKSGKPKFENFVDVDGGIVAFDTNSSEGAVLALNLIEAGGRKALATDAVPTVDQGKNAGFALRSESASDIIEELGTNFTGFASIGQRLAPNIAKSAERQQFEQAERNLINSVLRKESGAVISDAEFDNARQQYIPQPGDSTEVVAQKADNRRQIIAGMRASAGKGALRAATSELQKLEAAAKTPLPTAINPQTGEVLTLRSGEWQK